MSVLLRNSNISKSCGVPVSVLFSFLLLLAFQGKNLFRFLNSNRKEKANSKNTYYRFLSNNSYNWIKFLSLLSCKVISYFSHLTKPDRVKAFVIDDSVFKRNCSKNVELLAKVFDHAGHSFVKGFIMLTLGWTDGYSFVPVGFNLLSSAKESNRYQEANDKLDKRSNGYKIRKQSMLSKPKATIKLLKNALDSGIIAEYVLMDTWFTNEPMIKSISELGLEVIGMVKQLKQRYIYNEKSYTLVQLQRLVKFSKVSDILGSLKVTTKDAIQVKIVFVKNRNKKSECLYILCTDMTLSDEEIIRIYGNRWSIECFFKAIKSLMKLETEFQVRDYMSIYAHTTIVFTRYIIIEYIRRNTNDLKSQGKIFYVCCEDIQDMDFSKALRSLMIILTDIFKELPKKITRMIESQLSNWIASQSSYINNLFRNLCWES